MAEAAQSLSERLQPIASPAEFIVPVTSRIAFSIRRFADLQLGTIWTFLEPRLFE